MNNDEKKETGHTIYVPVGADINLENSDKSPPKTEYERRKMSINQEAVKNLVRGEYGKTND